jgi:hypothetical protein
MPKDKSEKKEKKGKKVIADDVEMADAEEPQVCIHQNFCQSLTTCLLLGLVAKEVQGEG